MDLNIIQNKFMSSVQIWRRADGLKPAKPPGPSTGTPLP